jgi:hypothetical protein
MTSANKRGRTLFEILSGRNKRDLRPLELQYHNPLEAKVGCTVSFDHEPAISGINFVIEKISVYQTKINSKSFYHTDYHLKGVSLDSEGPIRTRLRLIADSNVEDALGHRIQLLDLYDEMEYDEDFVRGPLANKDGILEINQDDEGIQLAEPRKYWRVESVIDPYKAQVTVLKDVDGDGTIEEEELERYSCTYWDYARDTDDPNGQSFTEFLTIEMNDTSGYLTFLRGRDVLPAQISVF